MSGIAGIAHLGGAPVDRAQLQGMAASLRFRGPDGQRVWTSGNVGFVHSALHATPESPLWPQPLGVEERWLITGDVRLDGVAQLKGKLQARGLQLPPHPDDSLLVLHAYRLWRRECLQHLRGDFCFALWDASERRLFCARDQLGVKPFFYAFRANTFSFSNSLECLHDNARVPGDLDDSAIADFLLFGAFVQPEDTCYACIRRLPAAHWLEVGGGELHVERYWSLPCEPRSRRQSAAQCQEEFRELLTTSIAERLRAPAAGVLMSGGLDSTAVAAFARNLLPGGDDRGAPLRAYTYGFQRLLADEEPKYAQAAASSLAIPWHYRSLDDVSLYETYRRGPLPEPTLEILPFTIDALADVSEHARVALTGQGGDVILHPPTVGGGLRPGHLRGIFRYAWEFRKLPRIGLRTAWRNRRGFPSPPQFPSWVDAGLVRAQNLRQRWAAAYHTAASPHPARPEVHSSLQAVFWSQVLESYDAAITLAPVDVRHPFLSLSLVEFALFAPVHAEHYLDKALLRRTLKGLLPDNLLRRPKTPLEGDVIASMVAGRQWNALLDGRRSPRLQQYVLPATPATWRELIPTPDRVAELSPVVGLNYWLNAREEPAAARKTVIDTARAAPY